MPVSPVRQVTVPPTAKRHSTLSRVDYADGFLVDTVSAPDRTAEGWARAILEDAPAVMRRKLRAGWSSLGLRIGSERSDELVLGWPVRRRTPDLVLLSASSRLGMPAELLIERRQNELFFGTFVEHQNPVVRTLWAGITPLHQMVVRRVLQQASHSKRDRR